jgi:hypothetical protein
MTAIKMSRRDEMLVEKIIILDWLAAPNPSGFTASQFAMTNKTEKKQRHPMFCGERSDEANRKFLINK